MPMEFCHREREDFPDGQFTTTDGVRMHTPPGGTPHPADPTTRPPRRLKRATRARRLRRIFRR